MDIVNSFNKIGQGENHRCVRDFVKMKPYTLMKMIKVDSVYGRVLKVILEDEGATFSTFLPKRFSDGLDDAAVDALNAKSGALFLVYLGSVTIYKHSETRIALISDLDELASLKAM